MERKIKFLILGLILGILAAGISLVLLILPCSLESLDPNINYCSNLDWLYDLFNSTKV